jgi:hypothetical protein
MWPQRRLRNEASRGSRGSAPSSSLAVQMDRIGPVRVLFVLEGFEGWEPQDHWSDLSFYVTYGQAIE